MTIGVKELNTNVSEFLFSKEEYESMASELRKVKEELIGYAILEKTSMYPEVFYSRIKESNKINSQIKELEQRFSILKSKLEEKEIRLNNHICDKKEIESKSFFKRIISFGRKRNLNKLIKMRKNECINLSEEINLLSMKINSMRCDYIDVMNKTIMLYNINGLNSAILSKYFGNYHFSMSREDLINKKNELQDKVSEYLAFTNLKPESNAGIIVSPMVFGVGDKRSEIVNDIMSNEFDSNLSNDSDTNLKRYRRLAELNKLSLNELLNESSNNKSVDSKVMRLNLN